MSESPSEVTPSCRLISRSLSGKAGQLSIARLSNNVKVVPSTGFDVSFMLGEGLRQQDIEELEALNRDPAEVLWNCYFNTGPFVFTVLVDCEPAAMFGVVGTAEKDVGVPWMIGTDKLLSAKRALVTESIKWIDFLQTIYPRLVNYVDERNTVSIRWLKAMGFEFPGETVVSPSGTTMFRRFTKCVSQ